jgi:cell division protein FtsL
MIKLLLCLAVGMATAVTLLQLRQQHMELSHQSNQLHDQIESRQATLWNQQLQIAVYTAPNAIAKTVGDHDLAMSPESGALLHLDKPTTPTPGQ